jgi:hypothetical protein
MGGRVGVCVYTRKHARKETVSVKVRARIYEIEKQGAREREGKARKSRSLNERKIASAKGSTRERESKSAMTKKARAQL